MATPVSRLIDRAWNKRAIAQEERARSVETQRAFRVLAAARRGEKIEQLRALAAPDDPGRLLTLALRLANGNAPER